MLWRPQNIGERPAMIDPLSEVISLLRPAEVRAKSISGAGAWGVRYSAYGHPSFCVVTDGACLLQIEGAEPLRLQAGDFVFLPATPAFVLSGFEAVEPQLLGERDEEIAIVINEQDPWDRRAVAPRGQAAGHGPSIGRHGRAPNPSGPRRP